MTKPLNKNMIKVIYFHSVYLNQIDFALNSKITKKFKVTETKNVIIFNHLAYIQKKSKNMFNQEIEIWRVLDNKNL